ncbi:hypothetical protein INT43_008030 [Umbelopsis isabellina]|uniref:Uncharacterized protein n=1 Tax=Mortierella isabellina TaxID=91625 RepID=A0A8H7PP48_MORIS|nr:hypothetical protein INT43_008030 [Umbelopsis isabellina]
MGRKKGLDPETAHTALVLVRDAKWSPGKTATYLNISRNAVRNLLKRFNETGSVDRKKGTGRRRIIDEIHYERIKHIVDEKRYNNEQELTEILNQDLGLNVSTSTYRRTIEQIMKANMNAGGKHVERTMNGPLEFGQVDFLPLNVIEADTTDSAEPDATADANINLDWSATIIS